MKIVVKLGSKKRENDFESPGPHCKSQKKKKEDNGKRTMVIGEAKLFFFPNRFYKVVD